ncbi:MAG TPA: ABC transporter permease [Bacteroidota bacterium]|nr:ABC transporter permease [Bacteroidota bacterium]
MNILPVVTLIRRELLRFVRERSRMVGVIASPILFWIVIGSGLNRSFQQQGDVPEMNYLEYFFPGSIVLIVLFAAIFSSMSVIEDRKEGFMQSVLVAPVSRLSIVMGKVIGITLLATLQGALLTLASPLVIADMTIGNMLLTIVTLTLLALGLSSLGFAIAWSMSSTQGFHAIMNLLLIPLWMLSGSLFPASGASDWVSVIMRWNPLSYGVAAVRASLYGLRPQYIHDLAGFGTSLAILFIFAVAMLGCAIWRVGMREKGSRIAAEDAA